MRVSSLSSKGSGAKLQMIEIAERSRCMYVSGRIVIFVVIIMMMMMMKHTVSSDKEKSQATE